MIVTIDRLDHFGRGITDIDGKITFVYDALPKEKVDIEITKETKKYNEASVREYITKSELRTKSKCPYFLECGGCSLRHMHYKGTLEYKKNKVADILNRYADLNPEIKAIRSENKNYYRNKIELKCLDGKYGFYESKTHKLVPIDRCLNAEEPINKFLLNIDDLNLSKGDITIKSNANSELLIVVKTDDNPKIDIDHIVSKNRIAGIIVNDKTVYGVNYFLETINNMIFKESYDSFFQVNRYINSKIFEITSDNINENDFIADLCCGVGTLGINASKKASKVYGIEIVPDSVNDAIWNANMNKRENMEFMCGNAFKLVGKIDDKINTYIIDPPRNGISKDGLNSILKNRPLKLIYVSCDPVTMARDLNILKGIYNIAKFYILDAFPYTYHVESIAILTSSIK